MAAADVFRDVSWAFHLGLAVAFDGREVTKWRLRRLRNRSETTGWLS